MGPILAQGLGVVGRGQVSAASSVLFIAVTIAAFGVPEAANFLAARDKRTTRKLLKHTVWILTLHGVVATIAIAILAPILSGGSAATESLIYLAAIATVPTLVTGALRGVAQGLYRWDLVNSERYWTAGLRFVPLAGLLVFGILTPALAVVVLGFAPAVSGAVYIGLRSDAHKSDSSEGSAIGPREILGYGSSQWIGSMSGIILSRIDQVLMTPLAGSFQLGIYAVAVNVAEGVLVASTAVRMVVFSAEASSPNDERVAKASRMSLVITAALGALLIAPIWIWLPVLFGQEFRTSIGPSIVLIAGTILSVPGFLAGAVIAARGRPLIRSISLIVAALVNIACVLALVPPFGAMGAAYATLVGSVVGANINIWAMRRMYGVSTLAFYAVSKADLAYLFTSSRDLAYRALRRSPDR